MECICLHAVTSFLVRQATHDTTLKGSGVHTWKGAHVLLQIEYLKTNNDNWSPALI